MDKNIYLDYNATTPVDPEVLKVMIPYLEDNFGNPSSSHIFGLVAKKAVMEARSIIASMLNCRVDEIIFTSGGSESNNFALKGAALAQSYKGNHIITSSIEHPSVLEVCRHLEHQGFEVTYLPVDEYGMVDPVEVEKCIRPQTVLISIMHANNEVGTIEPVREISRIAHKYGIIVHSDCAQSLGKIPVDVQELGCDMLTVAGHKIYAPKGIGALYVRSGLRLEKLIHGASHEMNLRAGTENVPYIAALGEACRLICDNLKMYSDSMAMVRDYFEHSIMENFPWVRINGSKDRRLPNTSSLSFKALEANLIISALKNVAVSAGAACHSEGVSVSHVLEAMKVPMDYAMGTLRVSMGRQTTKEEIDLAVSSLKDVIETLRPKEESEVIKPVSSEIKLTEFTSGLGCACKMRPQVLEEVLKCIAHPLDKNVLVGIDTSDDAAVYRISEKEAVISTVDFFSPVVDDAFTFGKIAAANALSDIYAMGARPLFALSIAAFPINRLPLEVLKEIVRGANETALEAGISIIGGHTVDDLEPKFGLAVTGIAEAEKIIKNSTMKPGDRLVLTKPLGTGIYSTALKAGLLDENKKEVLTRLMIKLNREASEAMMKVGVNACTDVTGFGLLGHMLEMVKSSGYSVSLEERSIPVLPGLLELAFQGAVPGGSRNNELYTAPFIEYASHVNELEKIVLNDAQTSGGLLISVAGEKAGELIKELNEKETVASLIGIVTAEAGQTIRVPRGPLRL